MGTLQPEVVREYFFYDPERNVYYNELWTFTEKVLKTNYYHIEILEDI